MILLVSGQPEIEMDPEVFRRCARVYSHMLIAYQNSLDEGCVENGVEAFRQAASQKSFVGAQFSYGLHDVMRSLVDADDLLAGLNQLCVDVRLSSLRSLDELGDAVKEELSLTYVLPGDEVEDESVYISRFVECVSGLVRYNLEHYKVDPVLGRLALHDPKDDIANEISQDLLGMLNNGFSDALETVESDADWQPQ